MRSTGSYPARLSGQLTALKGGWPLLVRALLVVSTVLAGIYSLVLARAAWLFHQDTTTSVPAAVKLVPFNSTYLARLAAWQQQNKVAFLRHAVEVNPFDSEWWIQLGLANEFQQHDNAAAERCYLRAAAVNKMFLPKWTLTNYYFRHGNEPVFFSWAQATLAITPYSPEPVFTQMWLVSQDAKKIAAAIPDRPRILLPYAWFLSNAHQYASLDSIVKRLLKAAGNKNPMAWGRDDLLANIEDRLISDGERQLALNIWGSMVRAGWLLQNVPNPDAPITNGKFQQPFFHHGFDWVPLSVQGITSEQIPAQNEVRFQFSGDQPESCLLLKQILPLEPGQSYAFRWRAEPHLLESPSGLTWHLKSASRPEKNGAESPDLSASSSSTWRVQAPSDRGLALLTLEYTRPLGHLRARGTLVLQEVSASPDRAPHQTLSTLKQ